MRKVKNILNDIARVFINEFRLVFTDVGALIFIVLLPLVYPVLYSLVYNPEIMKDIPVAVVDDCRTPMSREYARMLDATDLVKVAGYAANMQEAKMMLNRKDVFGVVYLPSDFSRKVGRGEQTDIEVYADMSVFLRYKNILSATTLVGNELGTKAQNSKLTGLENAPTGSALPIPYRIVPLGNRTMGMATAILPGILVMILQQVFILCISLIMATSRERKLANGGIDPLAVNVGAFATLMGKALCYFLLMLAPMVYLWRFTPIAFSFPQNGSLTDVFMLAVPFIFAVIFFAMTLQTFIRKRETVFCVIVVTSVFFVFVSGISWPRFAINPFWTIVGDIIPSTWAIQALWGISNMGATLAEQSTNYLALWALAAVYFVISYLVLRFVDHQRKIE
ncbi:MAG: ABC transporter permease [Muribaculaceae bacterium]